MNGYYVRNTHIAFITLTTINGFKVSIMRDYICALEKKEKTKADESTHYGKFTRVFLSMGMFHDVRETPEEIFELANKWE